MTAKKFRVAEIFGPTLQGEGPAVGQPVYFIRFGGCDFRCSWCDSKHAVDSDVVRHLPLMTAEEIMGGILNLHGEASTVVLSGGNPLLWDLEELTHLLHQNGYDVHVETQGSLFKNWLYNTELITISPKPPSAGVVQNIPMLEEFISKVRGSTRLPNIPQVYLKIVVFNRPDLIWAISIAERLTMHLYISVGTEPDDSTGTLLIRYNQITEWVLNPKDGINLHGVTIQAILPQMHVLMYGHRLGV